MTSHYYMLFVYEATTRMEAIFVQFFPLRRHIFFIPILAED